MPYREIFSEIDQIKADYDNSITLLKQKSLAPGDQNWLKAKTLESAEQLLTFAKVYHGEQSPEAAEYQKLITALGGGASGDKLTPRSKYVTMGAFRGYSSVGNMIRLAVTFSRLSTKFFWLTMQSFGFLDQSNRWMGVIPVDIARMEIPVTTLNFLSVALFFSRFLNDFVMTVKHVGLPSSEEAEISTWDRAWHEIVKRHWRMVNDLVWTVVNLFTNYAMLFHIPDPVANTMVAGFLLFDFMWLCYAYFRTDAEHKRLAIFFQQKYENAPEILGAKLQILETTRQQSLYGLIFCMGSALTLMSGFSIALFVASPLALPIGFFICTLAVAGYMSYEKFGAYMVSKPETKQEAWQSFTMSMAERTFVPLFLVGLYAIHLPIALMTTFGYVGYKLYAQYESQPDPNATPSLSF